MEVLKILFCAIQKLSWRLFHGNAKPYLEYFSATHNELGPTHSSVSTLLFFQGIANFENLGSRTRAIFADDISYFNKNYFEVFQIKRKLGTDFKRSDKRKSYE